MLFTKGNDVLVAILALCQGTAAFYPYIPDYRCVRDPNCDPSGNPNVPSVEGRATTLKLSQRLPKVGLLQFSVRRRYANSFLAVVRFTGCRSQSPS